MSNIKYKKIKPGDMFGYWMVLFESNPLIIGKQKKRIYMCECTSCGELHEKQQGNLRVASKVSRCSKCRSLKVVRAKLHNNSKKKGRMVDKSGYVKIRYKDHPNSSDGYIFEHRLVMEESIGRILTKKEVVHHVNGIKGDNNIENLELFNNTKEHISHHKKLLGNELNELTKEQVKLKKEYKVLQMGKISARDNINNINKRQDEILELINIKS